MNLALYEPPFVAVSEAGHRAPPDSVAQLTRMIATGRRGEAVKFYLTQVMGAPRILYYGMRIMPLWRKMQAVAPSLPYDAAIMGTLCRHRSNSRPFPYRHWSSVARKARRRCAPRCRQPPMPFPAPIAVC